LPHRTLNLGILAHVDAGKTTLTERLLYAAGAIDEIGSVDAGTTQTDSLALERQRGITIKAAVVSFAIGDVTVNLIDTPGHPDFIAEVERVLSVLDGAVLVISAVEGVQPQTRVLMRALRRLGIPTLLFVNKIDRPGASAGRVLRAIAGRLSPAIIAMESVHGQGSRAAEVRPWAQDDTAARARLAETLAERDDAILADYVEDQLGPASGRLRRALAAQSRRGLIHPVFFGSAITGAGVEPLITGLPRLLPTATGRDDGPVCGRVFKIERGPRGEKIAYVRMFSGTVRTRDRLRYGRDPAVGDGGAGDDGAGPGTARGPAEAKVTAIGVFERGPAVPRPSARAGQIATFQGLTGIRIGDYAGQPPAGQARPQFAPPALESVVLARYPGDRARLRAALSELAEADPLINVRQAGQQTSVSLYGEVQKEVIQATLAGDFGIEVTFHQTTTIYVERPAATGEAAELIGAPGNPFPATLGLRVAPGRPGSGLAVGLDVGVRSVPMYVYKTVGNFAAMMTQYVTDALREGLSGWRVTDCAVTVNQSGYVSPSTTAAHYRKLTPLVLMAALQQAGTVVCEPVVVVSLEIPADAAGAVLAATARLGGVGQAPSRHGDLAVLETVLSAARAQDLQRMLPGLTSGEGVAETRFGGYRPVSGPPPTRPRSTANPLNRDEYMLQVAGRAAGPAAAQRQ
jgi:ribosomal protection tetracycline resistance protein